MSKNKTDFDLQLRQWDEQIRHGKSLIVKNECRKFNFEKVPRNRMVDYANIARRVGLPHLVVRWLRPIVRSEKKTVSPTPSERALYGLGLLRIGAFRESFILLKDIDRQLDPQIDFYLASFYINQWNYKKAIPKLNRYLRNPKVSGYQKLVGRINLCACLVAEKRFQLAQNEIKRLKKKLGRSNHSLLSGNLIEIEAQLFFAMGRYSDSLKCLEIAEANLQSADQRSLLYVAKWKFLINLHLSENPESQMEAMNEIQNRARSIEDWETCRELDYHFGRICKNVQMVSRVYWGTRFGSYKERLLKECPHLLSQMSYWTIKQPMATSDEPFDLVGEAPSPSLQKLMYFLSREFYSPLRTSELIDSIYANEYYHPTASKAKLERLIARARIWIAKLGLPVKIVNVRNNFKLEFQSSTNFIFYSDFTIRKKSDFYKVPNDWRDFSALQFSQFFKISLRTTRRILRKMVLEKKLEIHLRGPRTFYRATL